MMGKMAVVRDDESMTGRITRLQDCQGTHQIGVHAVLDLEDPINEILLLTLEITSVLGVLDSAEDAKHARGCPTVTCAGTKPDEEQTD